MCMNTLKILEEFYMTKLIQFIVSDRLYGNVFCGYHPGFALDLCQGAIPEPGADLGCRCKFIKSCRISGFLRIHPKFQEGNPGGLFRHHKEMMMYTVSIISKYESVSPVSDLPKRLTVLFGICVSLRVGIFRYTPDTFDRRIFLTSFFLHYPYPVLPVTSGH